MSEKERQSEPKSCPCGLSPLVCTERHNFLDKELSQLRTQDTRLESSLKEGIKDTEERVLREIGVCETHLLEKLGHQAALGDLITTGLKASYESAVDKVIGGLNRQGQELENIKSRVEAHNDRIPSNAIERLITIEETKPLDMSINIKSLNIWRWILTGVGLAQGVLLMMMWKYFDGMVDRFSIAIKAAEDLIK